MSAGLTKIFVLHPRRVKQFSKDDDLSLFKNIENEISFKVKRTDNCEDIGK